MRNKKILKKVFLYHVYVCDENYNLLNSFVFTPDELSSYLNKTIALNFKFVIKRKVVEIYV